MVTVSSRLCTGRDGSGEMGPISSGLTIWSFCRGRFLLEMTKHVVE